MSDPLRLRIARDPAGFCFGLLGAQLAMEAFLGTSWMLDAADVVAREDGGPVEKGEVAQEPDAWVEEEGEARPVCKWSGWVDDWDVEFPGDLREEAAANSSKGGGKGGIGRGAFRGGFKGGNFACKRQRQSSDRSGPPPTVCLKRSKRTTRASCCRSLQTTAFILQW